MTPAPRSGRAGKASGRRSASAAADPPLETRTRQFDDNGRMARLVGPFNQYLARIEQRTAVTLLSRGNEIALIGDSEAVGTAMAVVEDLYGRLGRGEAVGLQEVDDALRMARHPAVGAASSVVAGSATAGSAKVAIHTRKRVVVPRSQGQAAYIGALRDHSLVFGVGPAGTGKTYLAAAMAVACLLEGRVDRIVLSRPAVEAGERLGFLPGDLREKVDPYLRPLYDALYDMLPANQVAKRLDSGEIEIAPLAFMRGRTLSQAYIILDEAQNASPVQMKMFLTRLGEGSRMVVTGDLSQIDLPNGAVSGLDDALTTLKDETDIAVQWFDECDVVRHELVGRIVQAYARKEESGR